MPQPLNDPALLSSRILGRSPYRRALILITSLFFMWGLAYGLLDSLNKHFQDLFQIDKQSSGLLQQAYFGGYFLMALPAGMIMKRFGYKRGILVGLGLYAAGSLLGALFLFGEGATRSGYQGFLLALFVLACGLCCLETAANPYVTVLGPSESSEFRLNLSQGFNGVGSVLGPFLAAYLFFGGNQVAVLSGQGAIGLGSVAYTYLGIGILVILLGLLIRRAPLPEINEEEQLNREAHRHSRSLLRNPHFIWGVLAQFFYVAAQVGIAAFFINYVTENWSGITNSRAAELLGISLILFTIGRFVGSALMRLLRPNRLLAGYSLVNILLCWVVIRSTGPWSVFSLMALFFFESIMFPTIFSLAVKDLGRHTRRGGSLLVMSIAGGAFSPGIMGWIADHYSTSMAFYIPLFCFGMVLYYGLRGYRIP